ncbi:MAG: hypothetical protein ACRC2K_13290 [Clostridium sp.]
MGYNREQINGTTPQDMNKLNENFMAMWSKVFGDIDFSDTNNKLKEKICTQWIPVQGEGNLDGNYPMTLRFFIPPNTKTIKSSKFSFIAENYRMDSDVALGGGGVSEAPIALNMGQGNAVITSRLDATAETSCANWFGNFDPKDPDNHAGRNIMMVRSSYLDFAKDNFRMSTEPTASYSTIEDRVPFGRLGGNYFAPIYYSISSNEQYIRPWLDLNTVQHRHEMNHSHTFAVSDTGHTHTGSAKVSLPPHPHDLNAGIKVDTRTPDNVIISVNNVDVTIIGSSSGLIKNDVDVTKHLKIGEWNTIKASANMVARVVMYGTIEVITNYF